jgi:hypothetical protein
VPARSRADRALRRAALAAVAALSLGGLVANVQWIGDRADALHVGLIGAAVYEHHERTGRWPASPSDLATTTLPPLDVQLVADGHYAVTWPDESWAAEPEANGDRVLVRAPHHLTRPWRAWTCRGDLSVALEE